MADEPDNESGVKAYLPPKGPQNVHMVPYEWRENQGVHSVGTFTIESPESVIVTADRDAHRQLDNMNIEALPDSDAQNIIDAMAEGEDATVASIVEEHRPGASTSSESSESSESPEGSESSEIPDDLDALGYRELQDLAQKHNIRATQSSEELRTALESIQSGNGIPDEIDTADSSEGAESSDTSESSEGTEFSAYKGSQ